ncbi:MAG: signal peptidase II [Ruminococcaceae bacterium]|nr:signal peptidase II [Oscillospiraceae bacterium]
MMQLGILLITAGLVAIDQLTKWLAVLFLENSDPVTLIEGVFSLTYTENFGAAWSMFEGQQWLLIGVTSVMLLGMLAVLLSGRFRLHRMATVGGILVVAGGIGNLIDRVFRGSVVDFLQTDFMDFPIFNVADCFVVIGAILLFIYFVFFYSDRTAKPEDTQEEGASSDDADNCCDEGDCGDAT